MRGMNKSYDKIGLQIEGRLVTGCGASQRNCGPIRQVSFADQYLPNEAYDGAIRWRSGFSQLRTNENGSPDSGTRASLIGQSGYLACG